jgi:transcription initiation factor TFIID subunit TAF12
MSQPSQQSPVKQTGQANLRNPALSRQTRGNPTPDTTQIIPKARLEELLKQIDSQERLDPDVEDVIFFLHSFIHKYFFFKLQQWFILILKH